MKNILSFSIFLFGASCLLAQTNSVTVVQGACIGYDITLDGAKLLAMSDCQDDIGQELQAGTTYELSTDLSTQDLLNGVSTIDLVYIMRHLQGVEELDTPAKIIAADVDQDGAISTYDLFTMRANILGITATSDKKQYHLVKADHQFPVIDGFDINVDYSSLSITSDDLNGNGQVEVQVIKIGDVNNSAQ